MGYQLQMQDIEQLFNRWKEGYALFGPRKMKGEGMYSDTDVIRYEALDSFEQLEWEERSAYSFKEAILPITQILFYFTEETVTQSQPELEKPAILFVRSCDIHALKRLDEIYLRNRFEDFYYKRLRENVKLVLMGCAKSCSSGFCVSMGTNRTEAEDSPHGYAQGRSYDAALNLREDGIQLVSRWDELDGWMKELKLPQIWAEPDFVTENEVKVKVPDRLPGDIASRDLWKEYDSRCVACGRCNFVCPTCTCFTMQDIFYTDNGRAGERRRVQASCMVDGYSDVAGGGSCRKVCGERMRFKVLHKIADFKKQFGYQMCVGCGRCDDVCPEYISFSNCVNRVADLAKEGQ